MLLLALRLLIAPNHESHDRPVILLSDRLARLGYKLSQITVHLRELLSILRCVVLLLALALLGHHDYAGRSLCCAGLAELCAALDVQVRDVVVFAEHGDMRDDVHGRDVSGDDDDRGRVRDV